MEKVGIFYIHLKYNTAIWYILWPLGNLVAIWYVFPRLGILCQKVWQPCLDTLRFPYFLIAPVQPAYLDMLACRATGIKKIHLSVSPSP
jgi:hypothetical protein